MVWSIQRSLIPQHEVDSETHLGFVRNPENFAELDAVMDALQKEEASCREERKKQKSLRALVAGGGASAQSLLPSEVNP